MSTDVEAIRLCIRDVANGDDPEKVADYLIAAFFAPITRRADAAEAALARVMTLCDAAGAGNVVQPDGWLLSPEALRAAVGTTPTECLAYYYTGLVCHLRAEHEGAHSSGSVATPEETQQ